MTKPLPKPRTKLLRTFKLSTRRESVVLIGSLASHTVDTHTHTHTRLHLTLIYLYSYNPGKLGQSLERLLKKHEGNEVALLAKLKSTYGFITDPDDEGYSDEGAV